MRIITITLLAILSTTVHADAYKCKEPGGKLVFSSIPCPDDSTQLKAVPNANTTSSDYQRAQSDLERQKSWLNNRQVQQSNEVRPAPALPVVQDSYGNTEKIHACLMAVTATPRISGFTAASRRVECFRGTVGRIGECESSVSSTPLLTMSEENNLQARCRTFQ
jgi:hypothetical protein